MTATVMRYAAAVLVWFGTCVALITPASANEIDFGRYHALVVGINEYRDTELSQLETAVADARAIHDLLRRRYDFESRLLLNPTRYEFVRALDELRAKLSESDNLLIYYAGHGRLDNATDEGYWLPADAEASNRANWIPVRTVTSMLKGAFAKHILVVSDSCYSGTLTREAPEPRSVGAARGAEISRLAGKRSRTALTSGGLEPVNDGGGDGNSVFARAFLEILEGNTQVLDGQRLHGLLRRQVVLKAEQTPEYAPVRLTGHEGGDFLFVPRGTRLTSVAPKAALPAQKVDQKTLDLAFWSSVKDSTTPAALEEYLKQFPNGVFAGLARLRLEEFKVPTKERALAALPAARTSASAASSTTPPRAALINTARGFII